MVRVTVEVGEGVTSLRETVSAASVRQAVSVMRERHPEHAVRVVFPISPEDFFEDRKHNPVVTGRRVPEQAFVPDRVRWIQRDHEHTDDGTVLRGE